MKALFASLAGAAVVLAAGAAVTVGEPKSKAQLTPVSAFADISDKNERAVALFNESGKVILHPRCVNCHPAGDRPAQGEDGHPHQPLVVRGPDGLGAFAMRCTACHGPANFDPGRVPGNPQWHLAPIEMAWEGKTLGEICVQIKDKKRNGGKTLEELVHHMAEDPLVGWGWAPGPHREPVPGTQKAFGELIKAWVDSGGACPSS